MCIRDRISERVRNKPIEDNIKCFITTLAMYSTNVMLEHIYYWKFSNSNKSSTVIANEKCLMIMDKFCRYVYNNFIITKHSVAYIR